MKLETRFSFRQCVWIKELRITARILGVFVDADGMQYNCRWFINGEIKTGYLLEDEIEPFTNNLPPGFVRVEYPVCLSAPELS